MIAYLPAASIVMTMVGTIMIFLFGMPFRVKPEPSFSVLADEITPPTAKQIRRHHFFNVCSCVGLIFIILGGAIQTWDAMPK